jgi:hypothetical protein
MENQMPTEVDTVIDGFGKLIERLKLRQWCIEQAKGDVGMARNIFAFCCEDLLTWLREHGDAEENQ